MGRNLSWGEYVEHVLHLGAGVRAPGFDAEAHAQRLAALSARLDLADPTLEARFEGLERGLEDAYVTERVAKRDTCGLMLVSFVAGGRVGLHDHPEQSGFILCVGGQIEVDAFDVLPGAPPRLRRVFCGSLGPGDTASLTPERANVHRLHCPIATRLVDVFTPPLTDALRATSRSFALMEEGEPGVFSARAANRARA